MKVGPEHVGLSLKPLAKPIDLILRYHSSIVLVLTFDFDCADVFLRLNCFSHLNILKC